MKIIIAILIFSLIIIIHEFGHFLLAKKNGIGVVEFSVGMGPRLFSFVKNGTKYSLKLLPIGGSCMMLGEDELVEDDNAFNKKSVWARISVIAAGPIFNFILAFVLAMIIIGAVGYDPAVVLDVQENSPADMAGLKEGDVITKFKGSHIDIGRELNTHLALYGIGDGSISVTYKRDGKKNTISYLPEAVDKYMLGFSYGAQDEAATITQVTKGQPLEQAGIEAGDTVTGVNGTKISSGSDLKKYFEDNPLSSEKITVTYSHKGKEQTVSVTPKKTTQRSLGFDYNLGRVKTSPLGVIKYSAVEVKYWIKTTVESIVQLVTGKVSPNDLAGPVGIVDMIGNVVEQSKPGGIVDILLSLANMSILLSANLGVMNLLPIPALDGGRLVFLIIEIFRGKPIDQEKEGMIHMIGLMALMALMVFVMFNDIRRLF